jgi:hypothetical protein
VSVAAAALGANVLVGDPPAAGFAPQEQGVVDL